MLEVFTLVKICAAVFCYMRQCSLLEGTKISQERTAFIFPEDVAPKRL
jgi:hypothetical protein